MYETSGSCRFSDFVVYNSRATQTPRNLPAGAHQIGPPGPMYRHDTSPCSLRRVERSRRHAQSQLSGPGWEALAGARSRFLAAAPARDCLQHCDCAWRRMASDRSSQAIPIGFQASRPGGPIWGHRALRWRGDPGVVLLSGKSPRAKTFEPARLPAIFFF